MKSFDSRRLLSWKILARRLSFDLRKISDNISKALEQQGHLTKAVGAGVAGAVIRLVIRNKQRNKILIFRKDQHSQQSKK